MTKHSGWRRIAIISALGVLALVIGGYFGLQQFRLQSANGSATISELSLPDILGETQQGEQWLGKVVVVNHWASWCPPCIKEIPLLVDIQENYRERGLQVVGIAHDTADAARVFGDQIGIRYPSLVVSTAGAELLQHHGNDKGAALPYTAFFGRDGKLAATKLGLLQDQELIDIVESLL